MHALFMILMALLTGAATPVQGLVLSKSQMLKVTLAFHPVVGE